MLTGKQLVPSRAIDSESHPGLDGAAKVPKLVVAVNVKVGKRNGQSPEPEIYNYKIHFSM